MLDGQQVMAQVRSRNVPDGWRVVRVRAWRFLISGAVLLFAYAALINDLSGKASLAALVVPIPSLTWTVPTGSGFLLSFAVLTLVAIFLIGQYVRQRGRVLVLLPEGFVNGDLRTGQVRHSMAYAEIDTLALQEGMKGQIQLIPHVVLSLTDQQQQSMVWSIEDYYQMPPAEIARIILTAGVRANTFHGALAEEPSPQQVVETVEVDMAPKDWKVFTPNLPITSFIGPFVVAGILLFAYGAFINGYFITGPTLSQRFNSGRPFGEVLAGELFAWIFLGLFSWMIVTIEVVFWRRVAQTRNRYLITPTQVVLARKRTGAITRAVRLPELTEVRLSQWFNTYAIRYRDAAGQRGILVMPSDAFESPAKVSQAILINYARCRAKLDLP